MVLAIDQGASKTAVVLLSGDGKIHAAKTTGGACYFSSGVEVAFGLICNAAKAAAQEAGVVLTDIRKIYGGIAGANWPDEVKMLTRETKARFGVSDVTVVNDCVVALRAGTCKPNAIVLCAGSEFNCAVMAGGEVRHVYNNYISVNDAGGLALGSRSIQAVFDSHLGIRGRTALTKLIMEHFGCATHDELLLWRDRGRLMHPLNTIVPLLMAAAYDNDAVALDIIREFSCAIARYAVGGLRTYNLIGQDCDIVLSGGVFKSGHPLLYDTIAREVHGVSSQANIVPAEFEPVVGAALFALEDSAVVTCMESARKCGLTR